MAMLFVILVLEGMLALMALKELGLEMVMVSLGFIILLNLWVSTRDVKGNYVNLERKEVPWLYDGIARMARKAGISMPRVLILDDYIPNAYSFKNTVVLSMGLFEVLEEGEILAVAAHEIGHIKNGDTRMFPMLAYGRYLTMIFTAALIILADSWIVTLVALSLYALYEVARADFLKDREFKADETALRLLDAPMNLKRALEELKYYEDLRVKVKQSALPSIEPSIERKQKKPLVDTHPSYDERILRILMELNSNMFNQKVQ